MNHPLAITLGASEYDILTAICHGRRSVVDAKGKLAELFLYRLLQGNPTFAEVHWLDKHNHPDLKIRLNRDELHFSDYRVECKNIRSLSIGGNGGYRVELQKTRNSKDGKPTRSYPNDHFEILAVCMFNRTGNWTFLFHAANTLPTDPKQPRHLQKLIPLPAPGEPLGTWRADVVDAINDYEHAKLQGVCTDQPTAEPGRSEETPCGDADTGIRIDAESAA